MKCANCKFFEPRLKECRIRAPQVVGEIVRGEMTYDLTGNFEIEASGVWPTTEPNNWCGEFKPKFGND